VYGIFWGIIELEFNGEMELYCKETNTITYLNIEYGSKYKGFVSQNDEKLYTISGDLFNGANIINCKTSEKIDIFLKLKI